MILQCRKDNNKSIEKNDFQNVEKMKENVRIRTSTSTLTRFVDLQDLKLTDLIHLLSEAWILDKEGKRRERVEFE